MAGIDSLIPGMGIAEGVLGLAQSGYGLWQQHKGNKMAEANKRPTYEIPAEIQQNLTEAQQMALQGLPEEQKQQYIQNMQRTQSFGLGAMSDRKGGLAGLGGLAQQGADASMSLLSADSAARQRNQAGLMNARSQMAGYRDKAFEFNKAKPYYEQASAARAMQGAGAQNVWGGLGTVGGVMGRLGQMDSDEDDPYSGLNNRQKHKKIMKDVAFNPADYNYGLGEDIPV